MVSILRPQGYRPGTLHQALNFTKEKLKLLCSRGWFRSTDLWVMGPARFLCATLLKSEGSTLCNNLWACWYRNVVNFRWIHIELNKVLRIYLPSPQIFELYAPVHGRLSIPTFYLLQAAPPKRGQVKINIYSSCWSSPRKSLVKGERFVREWRKPRVALQRLIT